MTWTHFPWSLLDPKRNFLSNWVKKVWIHKQLLEMKFLLCWTRIQPFYLCLWSWLRMTVNSDLSKKRYLRNCLCKENLICFKHKVWWKRKLTVREGKIYFVFIWAGLSFRDSNTKRLFVCLFCSGNAILKQLVILEKLNRRSKYNCEKGIIHAHINQNIIFLLKKKKRSCYLIWKLIWAMKCKQIRAFQCSCALHGREGQYTCLVRKAVPSMWK